MTRRLPALAALAAAALAALPAPADEPPGELRVGVTAFLSGPASVFGEPARAAAEMMAADLNAEGGILGVPVRLLFIDEGAGGETLLSEYRRLVQDAGADAMFASISSGNCNKIAPLAEDLKVLNFLWDCGTQRIFEEASYRYVFRTQAHATPEMLSTLVYLLRARPDFRTIAVVNQDYAWGRESWRIFRAALERLKPNVRVVAELFPRFGAPDFSTEISRLLAARPDVVLSTSWGGDLDTFVRQAAQRRLTDTATLVLPLMESSLQRVGKALPEGVIVGARGDHYFLHPERRGDPAFRDFVERFRESTGAYPIYPVFHMSQALAALRAGYEEAARRKGGAWPSREEVVDALAGLSFQGLGRPVRFRADNQGVEAMLVGTTRHVRDYDFPVLDDMLLFDGAALMPPEGAESIAWIETLAPSFVDEIPADRFRH